MDNFIARTPSQMGAILRGYRRERKLTQHGVAQATGLMQGAISKIESNPGPASLAKIFKVLAALDLDLVVRPRGKPTTPTDW